MAGLVYGAEPYGIWVFLVLTVLLGGAAAWATGRALARGWRPVWQALPYMIGLAAVIRFLHYALFAEPLLSPGGYGVALIFSLAFAGLGFYATRRRQMQLQYGWTREKAP